MLTDRQLILSSSSTARRALLARLQIPFLSTSPDIDETPLPNEEVISMVKRLSREKAQASQHQYPEALIIGADQVGVLDHHVLGKPATRENAFNTLQLVSGKQIRFYTGLCLYDAKTNKSQIAVETYDVYFRTLSDAMIEAYLQKELPLHCAGSFHVEGLGITLIEKLVGEDYTALIGLPLIRLTAMLEAVVPPR